MEEALKLEKERFYSEKEKSEVYEAVKEASKEYPSLRMTQIVKKTSNITELLTKLENKDDILEAASIWMRDYIEKNQNPQDCSEAKYLYCPVMNSCGGGCGLHQWTYCFYVGLSSHRVVIFEDNWGYLRQIGSWNSFFKPLSSCSLPTGISVGAIPPYQKKSEKEKVLKVGFFSRSRSSTNFFPWACSDGFHVNVDMWVPEEIRDIVKKVHGDYRVWMAGHIERYMLRLTEEQEQKLVEMNQEVERNWKHPIVGIHVRRTDHKIEAPYRDLSDYMKHVLEWFDGHQISPDNRRVFLATDEPKVYEEAKEKYPDIQWLARTNKDVASNLGQRKSAEGTYSLFSDWKYLSEVDFLVGTSSSQVGRMAYELMQTERPDAGKDFVSLDDPWYFP